MTPFYIPVEESVMHLALNQPTDEKTLYCLIGENDYPTINEECKSKNIKLKHVQALSYSYMNTKRFELTIQFRGHYHGSEQFAVDPDYNVIAYRHGKIEFDYDKLYELLHSIQ
jgi:hypothetical protein